MKIGNFLSSFLLIFALFGILSITTPAQLDPTFGTNGVTTTNISGSDKPLAGFALPDGKTLVVSDSFSFSPPVNYYFVKYNQNGTLDTTYGNGGIVQLSIPFFSSNRQITNVIRQPDGKIILVGNDNSNGIIIRFNENGTLDTSFANGGIHRPNISIGFDDGINSAVLQSDGKIIVGGFAIFFGSTKMFLLRYTANGLLDETFGTLEGYSVYDGVQGQNTLASYLILQSTGKILVINPSDNNTFPNGSVRRFNSDGSVDGSFTIVLFPNNTFRTAFVQPDDKILIGSVVQKNETLERTHLDSQISRFNANGGIDTNFGTNGQTSFDLTSFFDDQPNALQVMPDGQILVGNSTYVQPNRSKFKFYTLSLARLSPSGVLNGKFLVTTSFPSSQNSYISILPDGKILTVYSFYNTTNNSSDILLTRAVGVPLQTYRFRGVPFDYNFPFNGIAKPTIFRPSDRKWYINGQFPGNFFGLSDDILVPSDYIKDFSTELAVFRPSNGTWYIARDYFNAATNYLAIQWGLSGDIPAPADYDGDGKSDLAVFRPSNGVWYIRNSANNSVTIVQWGLTGDKPAAGDFDGDGIVDIAVFRPSDGNWYILKSSDGQAIITHFGLSSDVPVQEDYDGDGKTDIAVWRPTTGVWYRLNSSDGSFYAFNWGLSTDVATPADYDGDLKTDIAVWRPSNGRWYVFQSSTNSLNLYNWGTSTDIPTQGKF